MNVSKRICIERGKRTQLTDEGEHERITLHVAKIDAAHMGLRMMAPCISPAHDVWVPNAVEARTVEDILVAETVALLHSDQDLLPLVPRRDHRERRRVVAVDPAWDPVEGVVSVVVVYRVAASEVA